MDVVSLLLAARLLLSAVFGVAAAAKFADLPGTRRSLAEFGVPDSLVPAAALLLPAVELGVAVALLPRSTAWFGAVGAAVLLAVFLAAIAHQLAGGRRPDCHCFGQLHAEPIGSPVIVRNVLLLLVAGFIAVAGWGDPGAAVFAWAADLTPFERVVSAGGAAILAVLALQAMTLRTIVRDQRTIAQRLDGLSAAPVAAPTTSGSRVAGRSLGSAAPTFSLPSLDDGVITLDALRMRGKPVVLFFSDPNCGPCDALLPQIALWQRVHAQFMTVALITRGTVDANRPKGAEHGLKFVLVENDREVSETFGVWGTPSAVMVRADGTMGSLLAQAEVQVRELIDSLVPNGVAQAPVPVVTAPPPAAAARPAAAPPPAVAVAPSAEPAPPAPAIPVGLTMGGGFRPPPSPDVTLDMKPKREDCVQDEELPDGGTVLYNGCRRQVLTLNGTAALVWEYCDGEHDVRTIVGEVREVFPAAAEIELDVRDVIHRLVESGMVASAGSRS